jgi:hypothetical protein
MGWSDSVTARQVLIVPAFGQDASGIAAEGLTCRALALASFADNASVLSETVAPLVRCRPSFSDTVTFTDGLTGALVFIGLPADSISDWSDSVAAQVLGGATPLNYSFSDTAAILSEGFAGLQRAKGTGTDSFLSAEGFTGIEVDRAPVGDSVTQSEGMASRMPYRASASDSISLSEVVAGLFVWKAPIADSATASLADFVAYTLATPGAATPLTYSFGEAGMVIVDQATAIEAWLMGFSDTVSVTEGMTWEYPGVTIKVKWNKTLV